MNTQTTTIEILDTGLTQAELAQRLGCSQSLISAFVLGKRGSNLRMDIGRKLEAEHRKAMRKKQKVTT